MTKEKVIEGLEELRAWLKHLQTVGFHGDIPEYRERELTVSDALALLREQPPTLVYCPNCGAAVEVKNNA